MAKFIVNAAQTTAISKAEIVGIFIKEIPHRPDASTYTVFLRHIHVGPVEFETATTLEEAKQKAAPILAELEAA